MTTTEKPIIDATDQSTFGKILKQDAALSESINKCKAKVLAYDQELKNLAESENPTPLEEILNIKMRRRADDNSILRTPDGRIKGYQSPLWLAMIAGNVDDPGLGNKIGGLKVEGLKKCEVQR